MSCKILSVRAKEGKTPLVIITVLTDDKKQKYTISEGTYREIGCPLSGEEIDEEKLSVMLCEDEKRRALLKSLNTLAYADNNKATLRRKLRMAGFSSEASEEAIRECVMRGYIDEERQAERLILKHASELLGPYKIRAKLVSRSYSPSLISKTMKALEERGEVNFRENRALLLSSKLPDDASYDEKMKLLYKYGYVK